MAFDLVINSLAFYEDEDARIKDITTAMNALVDDQVLRRTEIMRDCGKFYKPDGPIFVQCEKFPSHDEAATAFDEIKNYPQSLINALTTRDYEIHRAMLSLDQRLKQVPFMSREEVAALDSDKARIKKLKTEDNFPSAMSLFEGILATNGKDQLSLGTFIRLLRSCAYHSDVKSAIHVFAQLESLEHIKLKPVAYQNMMLTFINAGRVEETEEIFRAYIAACKSGRLGQHKSTTAEIGRTNRSKFGTP